MTASDHTAGGELHALGHAGSDSFVGLEIIELTERLFEVTFTSDEFTAVCPVTGQPDLYELQIRLLRTNISIESKSLKIYLNGFRNKGCFAENLVTKIKRDVEAAIKESDARVHDLFFEVCVSITQKARGGITIEASS
jgi:7-cyano-7-deazaguanine reductase